MGYILITTASHRRVKTAQEKVGWWGGRGGVGGNCLFHLGREGDRQTYCRQSRLDRHWVFFFPFLRLNFPPVAPAGFGPPGPAPRAASTYPSLLRVFPKRPTLGDTHRQKTKSTSPARTQGKDNSRAAASNPSCLRCGWLATRLPVEELGNALCDYPLSRHSSCVPRGNHCLQARGQLTSVPYKQDVFAGARSNTV